MCWIKCRQLSSAASPLVLSSSNGGRSLRLALSPQQKLLDWQIGPASWATKSKTHTHISGIACIASSWVHQRLQQEDNKCAVRKLHSAWVSNRTGRYRVAKCRTALQTMTRTVKWTLAPKSPQPSAYGYSCPRREKPHDTSLSVRQTDWQNRIKGNGVLIFSRIECKKEREKEIKGVEPNTCRLVHLIQCQTLNLSGWLTGWLCLYPLSLSPALIEDHQRHLRTPTHRADWLVQN